MNARSSAITGAALFLFALGAVWAQGESPAAAQTALDQAIALGRAGRWTEAETVLLEGQRRFPSDSRFPVELAGVAYRQNRFHAAKGHLRDALRLDAEDRYANDFLGTLYLLDGNVAATLKYWNRIEKPLIQHVLFVPPPPLDPLLRDRTFDISAGQVFTYRRLLQTEANVAALQTFSECRFDLAPQSDQQFDLTIRTVPAGQPLHGWIGTAASLLRGLPYQTLFLDFYNLRRRSLNLSALWRWDAQKRRAGLDFSGPLRGWRYHLVVDARQENWDLTGTYFGPGNAGGLVMRSGEAGADLARNLSERLKWTLGARLSRRWFQNAPAGFFFSNSWTTDIRNRFDWLLWDSPDRRARINAFGTLRTGRILTGSPGRLISTEAGASATWYPQARGNDWIVTADLQSGATFGSAPLDQLFILGMERDNDLWLRGHVGTRDGRKGSAPMGREYLLARTQVDRTLFHFPLLRIAAGPFLDSGRIGDSSGQFGSRGWLCDTGIQAKIASMGGLTFSAVYGRNLRDGTGVFYTAIRR